MNYKFRKNIKIINDLLTYCHLRGALEYHVDISLEKGGSVYNVEAKLERFTEEEREHLSLILNVPRQHEVEQNYWGLSGDVDTDPEMELIGMMIDKAEVTYADSLLKVTVYRKEVP